MDVFTCNSRAPHMFAPLERQISGKRDRAPSSHLSAAVIRHSVASAPAVRQSVLVSSSHAAEGTATDLLYARLTICSGLFEQ
jgi:hypothetical protein